MPSNSKECQNKYYLEHSDRILASIEVTVNVQYVVMLNINNKHLYDI